MTSPVVKEPGAGGSSLPSKRAAGPPRTCHDFRCLRRLALCNPIMSTAHAPSYEEGGPPRDRYRLYHAEQAKGGIGLTIIGGLAKIAPHSPSVFGQLYAGDDSIIAQFTGLTNGVRFHGAAVMRQITHMGRCTAWDAGHWRPVAGPKGTRDRAHRSFPKTKKIDDINRVCVGNTSAN